MPPKLDVRFLAIGLRRARSMIFRKCCANWGSAALRRIASSHAATNRTARARKQLGNSVCVTNNTAKLSAALYPSRERAHDKTPIASRLPLAHPASSIPQPQTRDATFPHHTLGHFKVSQIRQHVQRRCVQFYTTSH